MKRFIYCMGLLPFIFSYSCSKNRIRQYEKWSTQQMKSELVEIITINPRIRIDIKYATANNFTKQIIYSSTRCYLAKEAAHALSKAQDEFEKMGYGLLIWDVYRPLPAQWKLWNIYPDEKYVSDPRKGGRHMRGTAVDATLIDLKTNKLLEMPTDFDDFTEKAWRSYNDLPSHVKKNRQLLQEMMEKHGFIGYALEWWHFDYQGWKNYEPLSIDFDALDSQ